MPMHCADGAPVSGEPIRKLLAAKGARRTWRRHPAPAPIVDKPQKAAQATADAAVPRAVVDSPKATKPNVKDLAAQIAAEMDGLNLDLDTGCCFDTGGIAGGAMDDLVKPLQFGPRDASGAGQEGGQEEEKSGASTP